MDVFEFVCLLRGVNVADHDGPVREGTELVNLMRRDPQWGEYFRSGLEHHWSTCGRPVTEEWMKLLVAAARYLSDLIGGDVPLLAPRDAVEASVGICRTADAEALLIGKAVHRSIANQVSRNTTALSESVLEELRRLIGDQAARAVPASSKWLSTRDIAARLAIDVVTAARLCKKGLILAEKTQGGQWRTTEEQLRRSSYLNGQTRRRRRQGNGDVE